MGTGCFMMEVLQAGSATNGATPPSFDRKTPPHQLVILSNVLQLLLVVGLVHLDLCPPLQNYIFRKFVVLFADYWGCFSLMKVREAPRREKSSSLLDIANVAPIPRLLFWIHIRNFLKHNFKTTKDQQKIGFLFTPLYP